MIISNKRWVILFIIILVVTLSILGSITIIIDPYFHYHKPISCLQYPINKERYQNNGIMRNFDYNAIITGTSMTENFKTSEFNEIFNTNAIKIPVSGASYKEINDQLQLATKYNNKIKIILRCLDSTRFYDFADTMTYEKNSYPTYLYDDFFYNDIKYFLNKDVLLGDVYNVVEWTINGKKTTKFDDYANWMENKKFGKDEVCKKYKDERAKKINEIINMSQDDYKNETENITQNVTDLADKNPDIEFYLFFPPYSICYWDDLNQRGKLQHQLDAEKYAIELLLKHKNIHLYSFNNNYELICDLNNYKDIHHYHEDINSKMLVWIKNGEYEITEDNYKQYCEDVRDFYTNYDYESLFK